jgi:hypothetical protein
MKYHISKIALAICVVLALLAIPAAASPIITAESSPDVLANSIIDPTNVTFVPGSATYIGNSSGLQSARFTGGSADIGFDSGIILSTGNAVKIQDDILLDKPKEPEILKLAHPRGDQWSTSWSGVAATGVGDLAALVGPGTKIYDPNAIEFRFSLGTGSWNLSFNYVFASEEYVNFVGAPFNDAFGLFIDGLNVGILSDGTIVSVNSIYPTDPNQPAVPSAHSNLYRNNVPAYYNTAQYLADDPNHLNPTIASLNLDIEPDGLTTVLSTQALYLGQGEHSARLIIGDVGDSNLDSAVFIRGTSFSATPTPAVPEPGTLILIGTGLAAVGFLRRRNLQKQ